MVMVENLDLFDILDDEDFLKLTEKIGNFCPLTNVTCKSIVEIPV